MLNFTKIYQDYYKCSFLFVKSYVFDDMAAEDIVSESLVALWQTMKREEVEHPLSLLLTIMKNNSLNYLKSQERYVSALENFHSSMLHDLNYRINSLNACSPSDIFSKEVTEIIATTLASLSPQTRQVFEMSRYERIPVKDIAEKLDISTKAVEYHITKSLKALRTALKDYLPLFYWLFMTIWKKYVFFF